MFAAHHSLQAHHRYQLEVFFLFVIGLFFLLPYYVIIEDVLHNDIHSFQWYFFIPWATGYTLICLIKRNRIPKAERIAAKKYHLLYWIILGIALTLWYTSPLPLEKPVSLYYMYGIFTLFLADGYWNFTNTSS